MTTEVKALRPCTLLGKTFPNAFDLNIKEWFSQNHDENEPYEYGFTISTYPRSTADACQANLSFTNSPAYSTLEAMLEAKTIAWQTIASAQRPWLNPDDFKFVEGALYEAVVLGCDTYSVAGKCFYSDGEAYLNVEDARENFSLEEETYAFKPIVPFYSTVEEKQAIWDSFKTVKAVYFGKPTQNKFINCFNCIV
jgi:hypothetical protein